MDTTNYSAEVQQKLNGFVLPPESLGGYFGPLIAAEKAKEAKMKAGECLQPYNPEEMLPKSTAPKITRCASHISKVLDPRERQWCLEWLTRVMRARINEFDAIAVCGISGVLAGQPVAIALGKRLLVVRKATDKAHSCYKVEGVTGRWENNPADWAEAIFKPETERVAIIDDLIDTGATMDWIVQNLQEMKQKPVRIYLYNAQPFGDYHSWRSNLDQEVCLPIISNLTENS
jgi:adenine/guanine phosphoribosyltransferase-like PRPP-binding protein